MRMPRVSGAQCDFVDILCMNHVVAYTGRVGDALGFQGCSARGRALHAAACAGADAPLAFGLPHTRTLQASKRAGGTAAAWHAFYHAL